MTLERAGKANLGILRASIEQSLVTYAGVAAAPSEAGDFLALIDAGNKTAAIQGQLQQAAVDQARRCGVSWAAIGETLGITRQAAQQRFASEDDEAEATTGLRRIQGATAFNEMQLLATEGAAGNHLVGLGALYLTVKSSRKVWEHRRELALNVEMTRERLERSGWQYVGSWFPFHYFKRSA